MAKQCFFFNFLFRRKQYGRRHEGVRQGSLQLALTSKEQNTNPPGSSLSFACSILVYLRETLHESSDIFVEHAQYVARI